MRAWLGWEAVHARNVRVGLEQRAHNLCSGGVLGATQGPAQVHGMHQRCRLVGQRAFQLCSKLR
jgi:hypothetical protein